MLGQTASATGSEFAELGFPGTWAEFSRGLGRHGMRNGAKGRAAFFTCVRSPSRCPEDYGAAPPAFSQISDGKRDALLALCHPKGEKRCRF